MAWCQLSYGSLANRYAKSIFTRRVPDVESSLASAGADEVSTKNYWLK